MSEPDDNKPTGASEVPQTLADLKKAMDGWEREIDLLESYAEAAKLRETIKGVLTGSNLPAELKGEAEKYMSFVDRATGLMAMSAKLTKATAPKPEPTKEAVPKFDFLSKPQLAPDLRQMYAHAYETELTQMGVQTDLSQLSNAYKSAVKNISNALGRLGIEENRKMEINKFIYQTYIYYALQLAKKTMLESDDVSVREQERASVLAPAEQGITSKSLDRVELENLKRILDKYMNPITLPINPKDFAEKFPAEPAGIKNQDSNRNSTLQLIDEINACDTWGEVSQVIGRKFRLTPEALAAALNADRTGTNSTVTFNVYTRFVLKQVQEFFQRSK